MRNPLALILALISVPALAHAQGPQPPEPLPFWTTPALGLGSAPAAEGSVSSPHAVQWYEAAAVFGVVAASSLLDDAVRDYTQDHRSAGKDDVAAFFRHMGQPEVYATVGLGTLLTGFIAKDGGIQRAGGRITASLITAAAASSAIKFMVGRKRPNDTTDPYEFAPFSSNDAFPSGHTTMAFALAASVSDEIHAWPATVGLFGAASLTGWSRINDNKHWLSDVLGGAAVGITSAKIMDGHWTIFGLGQPHFLADPQGVTVSMSASF
jgi:membrane-associated phospholipid phosphatase